MPEPQKVNQMPKKVKGRCAKCKAERVMKNPKITEAAGHYVAKGVCPVCGATMTCFLEKKNLLGKTKLSS